MPDNLAFDQPILVWGAGAIGGTIGAVLAEAGREVTFVDRVAEHVEAIRNDALFLTGPLKTLKRNIPAYTPEEVKGTWSLVLLAVKAQDTVAASAAILPHLADNGAVVSLQNGLCETAIAEVVGQKRTIGAFINFGADWIRPGEIMFSNRGAVVVGELDGAMTPRLESLLKLMQIFEPEAIATSDIWSYLWGKLGYGSLLFAQAVGNLGIADCIARPELLPLWRGLVGEVMAVAAAEGIAPRGFNGFDPKAFGSQGTEVMARNSVEAMVAFNRLNPKTHSGVWRDLAVRKRRTEVDMQIAPIAKIGARHGIDCRYINGLVQMIHEVEAGTRMLSDANLVELLKC